MANLAPSFPVDFFSLLQVTRASIKALMSLNFGQILQLTMDLAALERADGARFTSTSLLE